MEIALKVFITLIMLGVEVVGINIVHDNLFIGILLIIIGILGITITLLYNQIVKRFFPASIKVYKLICWHIERPEPEHHGWEHCHEYNFHGEIEITPRIKDEFKAFYLLLRHNKKLLKIDSLQPNELSNVLSTRTFKNTYSFQIRLSDEINISSFAYIVLKFKHGEVKKKARVQFDDDYSPFF
ncbi:MAG: hypothetical protein ACOWWR_05940 [Eubacteriales bacterium]